MDALIKKLVRNRASYDPLACRGGLQDKHQALNDSKAGMVKALGENTCSD